MLWRVLGTAAVVYLAIVLLAWLFQHRLLYLPSVAGRDWTATPEVLGLDYADVRLTTEDDVELSAWWIPAHPERGTLLFLHGNAGNISHRLESVEIFHRLGLSVLIVDYRGYGQSASEPSEQGTYLDARAAWHYLVEQRRAPPERIVVFGRSLGAAVAAHLAGSLETGPAALILESAFTSAPEMAQRAYPFLPARWLTRFDYTTRDYVRAVDSPVLVLHGRDDEIVPFEQGESVFRAAPEPKRFVTLHGGHNTGFLESGELYTEELERFLAGMAALPRPGD